MRKDWFAPYAEKRTARPSKAWATRATRATPAGQAQETNDSLGKVDVARGSTPWATRATPTPDRRAKQGGLAKASGSVARIAQALPEGAERRELAEGAENSAFLAVIAHVAHVAHAEVSDQNGRSGWDSQEWHALFNERAAISEYDGGLTRRCAEIEAFQHVVNDWIARSHGI